MKISATLDTSHTEVATRNVHNIITNSHNVTNIFMGQQKEIFEEEIYKKKYSG